MLQTNRTYMTKRFLSVAALAALAISSCTKVPTGEVVLQGDITGDPLEVVVLSYLPGQSIGYHYPEVQDGKFEFKLDGVEGFADLVVSVGGMEFGARVNSMDTLRMRFTVNRPGEDVAVAYDGATEKESRIWTDFYETYCHWSNYDLTPDRDPAIPYEASIARLERNDSLFRSKYKDELYGYYARRVDLAHDLLKSIFLESVSYRDGTVPFDNPEYAEMVERTDPNDPDQVTFPMVIRWMNSKLREFDGDDIDRYAAFLGKYGPGLKDAAVKHLLARSIANNCMMEIDAERPEIYEPLFCALGNFVPEDAGIVDDCRARIEAVRNSRSGNPVPDALLSSPDGGTVQLSSLLGKVLYIDIWATWCGPCIKEGPYFRSLAEKYKDNPDICFVSISADSEDAPWLEFLEEEKPFWPQYRFVDDFCDKVGIQTIPRFLLIDAEGRFIDADCARPSNDSIEMILNKAIND